AKLAPAKKDHEDDDWETDPDFVNDVSEKQSRWGSKSIPETLKSRSDDPGAADKKLGELVEAVREQHDKSRLDEYKSNGGFSRGYGGQFGVEKDRMDSSAHRH
ncbi:hypothetical protein BCR44DRAFT_36206, partial [Catenaria anguillulae PL171]